MSEASQPQSTAAPNKLPVYYCKSNYFRVIHVDGMYGGGTPTIGNVMMTVFSHRVPFPEKIMNDPTGKEIIEERVVKYGIENELEASLVMELKTAKLMLQWLDTAIKNAEEMQRKALGK
jgi:hypothetical protein